MNSNDKKSIQDTISLVVQQRYCWLFQHITRANFLDSLDKNPLGVNLSKYYFSLDDQNNGEKPIFSKNIILLLAKGCPKFAWTNDGEIYDWNYVRRITIDGMRASIVIMVQAYLEQYKIANILNNHNIKGVSALNFLKKSRDIILHSKGAKMNIRDHEECQWRNIKIKKGDFALKISDQKILLLIDDILEILVDICLLENIDIDFVSLNLGHDIFAIQKYIKNKK